MRIVELNESNDNSTFSVESSHLIPYCELNIEDSFAEFYDMSCDHGGNLGLDVSNIKGEYESWPYIRTQLDKLAVRMRMGQYQGDHFYQQLNKFDHMAQKAQKIAQRYNGEVVFYLSDLSTKDDPFNRVVVCLISVPVQQPHPILVIIQSPSGSAERGPTWLRATNIVCCLSDVPNTCTDQQLSKKLLGYLSSLPEFKTVNKPLIRSMLTPKMIYSMRVAGYNRSKQNVTNMSCQRFLTIITNINKETK